MLCPACGQENPERAKFCLECGTALQAADAPAPSRESRRVVTVVFADMVGFTSLGESLDQESLRRVMDRFYDGMRGAIEGEAGTLAKFIGDAVLAVWGTPEVHEDDALRAVRAAEAMRGELATINEELESRWGVRVGMRTGVNTGEVVVDPTRPADLLVGDTLNVAARLEQAAPDGAVLVGPETYRLVRDHCTLEAVEPLGLKGKARPMPAWRLVDGLHADRRSADRLQAPLIGRQDELAALRGVFDEAVAARGARMATVIGSPGLGKTRLVAEFIQSLGAQAIVLQGRCEATGEGITFQPVAEVLRSAAGITDDDTPEAARAKLTAVLPDDEPDRELIVDRAGTLLGLGPVATTEETFWAVRRVLEALARQRAVVVVHDDIHWGQPTFLDLLEHFVAWIRDAPVLVIGIARPELREVRPALAAPGEVAAAVVSLEPLDEAGSRAMVAGLLGAVDLPPGLAERILETTEGNPLFLGEMLRMLADEGVLRRQGDTWVAGDIGDVTVPPTIHALLAARIERLGGDERSVVERASVIGHQFYRGAVAELAPEAVRPGVDIALETLARKELVRPEDEWWLDERVFRFHHVLIRDAAYRTLLKEARADLHARFASWLEAKAGDLAGEHEEVVAFHLEQAHGYRLELGPLDDAGRQVAARAAARLHSAGRRALAREDLPAAANLLRRALAPLAGDAAGRLEVLSDLAETLLSAGDTGAAEQIVEELGLGADELGDERMRARAVVFASQLDNLTGAGHVRETAQAASAAADVLARHDDRAGEAKALQVVAQAEALLGQVAAAEAALDRALVAARAADDRRRITAVLSGAPRAALWGPAPIVRASGRCLDVVRILRMTPGNRHVEAAALRCQAVLEAMRGRAEAARGILEASRATLEELGLALELADTDVHAGMVELLAGEFEAAERTLRAAQDALLGLGVEGGAAQAAALLSRALLEQDRVEEALAATRFAEARGGEDLKTTTTWLGVRAEALARGGLQDEARELAARAVELTEPTDALADRADALMALAAVEGLAGDGRAAADAARRAGELYAAKDHSVGVERADGLAGERGVARFPDPPPAPLGPDARVAAAESAELPVLRRRNAMNDAFNRRDFAALALLLDRWYSAVDTRAIGWGTQDRDMFLASMTASAELGPSRAFQGRLLAAEGALCADVWALEGTTSEEGAAFDFAIGVVEIGGELALHAEIYEPDDATLLARFEELRPLAGATSGRSPEIAYARFSLAYNSRDWDAARALGRDDVTFSDRRNVGWEEMRGSDGFVGFLQTTVEAGPDIHFSVERVIARDERAIALTTVSRAHGEGGAEFVVALGHVTTFDEEGRFASIEFLDPDDEAGMRARFAEVAGAGPAELSHRPAELEHALPPDADPVVAELERRWAEAFNARDWEAAAMLLDRGYVNEDRRALGAEVLVGAEGAIANAHRIIEIAPDATWTADVIAADDRTALVLVTVRDADFAVDVLNVAVATRDGRAFRHITFEPEREPEARAEAEAWATHLRQAAFQSEILSSHDWERAAAELFAEDFVQHDHRAVGAAPIAGGAAYTEHMRDSFSLAPDATAGVEVVAVDGDRRVSRLEYRGHWEEGGGEGEVQMWTVTRIDGLRNAASDLYATRAEAEAALRAGARAEHPMAATFREHAAATAARDFDRLAALIAEDYVWVSHQAGKREEGRGREAGLETRRAAIAVEGVANMVNDVEILETRGDRLGLTKAIWRGEFAGGPFEVAFLAVSEIDEQGRLRRDEAFDLHDLERAHARLEELAGGGAVPAGHRFVDAFNARDWERLRDVFAATFRQADHRALGWEDWNGPEDVVHQLQALMEVAPQAEFRRSETVAETEDCALVRMLCHGGAGEAAFEVELLNVFRVDAEGRQTLSELFAPEQEEQARRRLAILSTEHPDRLDAFAEALNSGDDDALRALLADEFVQVDHRGIAGAELDREGFLAMLGTARDVVEGMRFRSDLIDVDGDRRLTRSTYTGDARAGGGDAVLQFFNVAVMRDGRIVRSDMFETEQEARAAFSPPAPPTDPAAAYRALAAAFNARDWEAYERCFATHFDWADLRPGTRHELDRASAIAACRQLAEDVPDIRTAHEDLLGQGRVGLARVRNYGTYEGGAFEVAWLDVHVVDESGRFVSGRFFSEEQEAEARELFAQLSAGVAS